MSEMVEMRLPLKTYGMMIVDRAGTAVADCFNTSGPFTDRAQKDFAETIVRAVNSHAALVEALDEVKRVVDRASDHWWINCPDKGGFDVDKIEEVIRLARGETK